jgi:hypothetical protein
LSDFDVRCSHPQGFSPFVSIASTYIFRMVWPSFENRFKQMQQSPFELLESMR